MHRATSFFNCGRTCHLKCDCRVPIKNHDQEQPKAPAQAMAFAPTYANKGKARVFATRVNEEVEDREVIEGMIYLKRNNAHVIDNTKVHILFDTGYTLIHLIRCCQELGLCMTIKSNRSYR